MPLAVWVRLSRRRGQPAYRVSKFVGRATLLCWGSSRSVTERSWGVQLNKTWKGTPGVWDTKSGKPPPPPCPSPPCGRRSPATPRGTVDGCQVTVPNPPPGNRTTILHTHCGAQKLRQKTGGGLALLGRRLGRERCQQVLGNPLALADVSCEIQVVHKTVSHTPHTAGTFHPNNVEDSILTRNATFGLTN